MAKSSRLLIIVCIGISFTFYLPPLTLQAQDSLFARRVICDLAAPEMYGRGMQHRGDSIAADYLRRELKSFGVRPLGEDYYQYFRFPQTRTTPPIVRAGYRSQNVCGYLPGKSDTMVVFTAHYEHLGMSGDTIFYGAHDNASGTAAVLDLARQLSTQSLSHSVTQSLRYTYVFLFFGGEESGIIGSRHFAEHPLIDFSKVKLLVNIDLFCGGDEGMMVVNANAPETKTFVDRMEQLNDSLHYAAKIGRRDNAANSDHWFLSQHCPAVFIYTLGGPYGGYHSPDDTCEGCGLGNYANYITLLRAALFMN